MYTEGEPMPRPQRGYTREYSNAEIRAMAKEKQTVSALVAGAAYGWGENATYAAIRRDEFPIPVIKAGGRYRVRTRDLIEDLRLTED
jgi:hypothetical protein